MLEIEIVEMARRELAARGDIPKGRLYSLAFSSQTVELPEAIRELEAMRPEGSTPHNYAGWV